jgi:hypothetical protein
MKMNYVLIDYENVQPERLSVFEAEHFKVLVFVGANQSKLTFEAAAALQKMGNKAEYVKISGQGPNALDFHVAFYIGHIPALEPAAYFHIISKDAGFDPLIQHLKAKKLLVARYSDVCEIPAVKIATVKSPNERLALVVTRLQHQGTARPRTAKTLISAISSIFHKQLSEQEVVHLLNELQAKSYVTVSDTKVSYALPTPDA